MRGQFLKSSWIAAGLALTLLSPAFGQMKDAEPVEKPRNERESADDTKEKLAESTLLFEGILNSDTHKQIGLNRAGGIIPSVYLPEGFTPRDRSNPFGVPKALKRKLDKLSPEIRLHLRDGKVLVEKRGWHTERFTNAAAQCVLIFDYRVNVVDTALSSKTTFGQIKRPFEFTKVLTKQVDGFDGLYVLIVPTVQVNTRKIGQSFTENHRAIAAQRKAANQSVDIKSMPRWYVVEHELVHAEQIRKAYVAAWESEVMTPKLCNPNRPTTQHRARLVKKFDTDWTVMTANGHAEGHQTGGYPNTTAETEARSASWALWDVRTP
jgi:hypothetical protein